MPKDKSNRNLLLKMVKTYEGVFKIEENWLFCNICCCKINCSKKSNVDQHIRCGKHQLASSKQENHPQKLITEYPVTPTATTFQKDLCKALLESNIPIKKVSSPSFKNFIEKYSQMSVPSETCIRQ